MTTRLRLRPATLAAALVACVALVSGAPASADDHDRFDPGIASLRGAVPSVTHDDQASPASPLVARARVGKIVVRNRSGHTADVYLAPDDGVTPFSYVNTLPSGFRLVLRGLPRRTGYVLYAEDPVLGGGWGPRPFFLRRKYVWTLLP